MTVTLAEVFTALLWAAVAAVAMWLVSWPLRRRSLRALLISLVLTCTAASTGALLGAVHAMLLPMGDEVVVLVLALVAGLLTAVATAAAARRIGREHAALRVAIGELRSGAIPAAGPRLSSELARTRDQLRTTASELAESRAREQTLDRSRNELVAWMSHDLRTPLAGLRAIAEALEDGVGDDPQVYFKQIGIAVDRLDGMVNDLFDLSRIRSGSLGVMTHPVPIGDVTGSVVAALAPLAAAGEVVLREQHAGAAGADVVLGNADELSRAVTNVVANAIRHTRPTGEVVIDVRARVSSVAIEVADACGGIEEDHLPHLFDVGFRASSARTPDSGQGRAGLGLAITRGIVEAHHGSVTVRNSAPGCCFRLEFPAAHGDP